MKILNSNRYTLAICLTLLMGLSTAQAQVYKWVDENGHVHYSETKPESGKAQTLGVKTTPPLAAAQPSSATVPTWQEQERRLRQRQAEEAIDKASKPAPARPQSVSNGREDGTDASKCALARDVLNGSLRHTNGAPLDKNDIDIAKSDVRNFCH
jgi:hypothetical protein